MEIERFRRNFRPPGCLRTIYDNFSKNFQKWRPFWIFEFSPKMRKHKIFTISLTVGDRAISAKFSTPRVSEAYYIRSTFEKIFKNGSHFEFSNFFEKVRKHKIASISLTVGDRAISSKFSTPRVPKKYTMTHFWKNFQKWRPFWIFVEKVRKHKNASISLTVGDRAISSKFSTPRVSKNYTKLTLLKKFSKMAAILNFRRKSVKTQNFLYLLNRWR